MRDAVLVEAPVNRLLGHFDRRTRLEIGHEGCRLQFYGDIPNAHLASQGCQTLDATRSEHAGDGQSDFHVTPLGSLDQRSLLVRSEKTPPQRLQPSTHALFYRVLRHVHYFGDLCVLEAAVVTQCDRFSLLYW